MIEKPKKELWKKENESKAELISTDDNVIMLMDTGTVVDRVFDRFESMSPENRDQIRCIIAGQDSAIKKYPDGTTEITPAKFKVILEKKDGN